MKLYLLKIIALFCFVFLCAFAANAQSGNSKNKSPDGEQTKDRPLKIISKEPPRVSVFGQCFKQYGTPYVKTLVRVTFDKSGKISAVELVNGSSCLEFDEESLRVARLIKFSPQVKDGEPVTVTKMVVYAGGVR